MTSQTKFTRQHWGMVAETLSDFHFARVHSNSKHISTSVSPRIETSHHISFALLPQLSLVPIPLDRTRPSTQDLDNLALQTVSNDPSQELFNTTQMDSQASDSTTGEGHEAVRAALQRRAAALAVDIAEGNDRVGRVVDLHALPVHADRRAVAVAGAAGGPMGWGGSLPVE